jgi:hypothetical protein
MKKRKLSSSLPYGPTVHLSLLPTLPLATTQLPSATELWHTPTRTSSVLMWRPYRRTNPALAAARIISLTPYRASGIRFFVTRNPLLLV